MRDIDRDARRARERQPLNLNQLKNCYPVVWTERVELNSSLNSMRRSQKESRAGKE